MNDALTKGVREGEKKRDQNKKGFYKERNSGTLWEHRGKCLIQKKHWEPDYLLRDHNSVVGSGLFAEYQRELPTSRSLGADPWPPGGHWKKYEETGKKI